MAVVADEPGELTRMRRTIRWSVALAGVVVLGTTSLWNAATAAPPQTQGSPVAASEITLGIDAAKSTVRYSVESTVHTVHGTFAVKEGSAVHFDPATGKAGGDVAVYATSGDSGNSSRDQRMHKEILETQKYPDFVFRPNQIDGTVVREGVCDVKLHGVMLIHGSGHDVTAEVHAELSGGRWKGLAKFDVPYIQWGIKDPSNWLLKVKPTVHVEVDIAGTQTSNS
jgi:polyisoprenoid-binding protein YceI